MFIMKNKKSHIQTNKVNLLKELLLVKDSGYLTSISLCLDNRLKIIYDPDSLMFKQEILDVTYSVDSKSYDIDELDKIPEYSLISILFDSDVSKNTVVDIINYVSQKYKCKCKLYHGNKLDIWKFE